LGQIDGSGVLIEALVAATKTDPLITHDGKDSTVHIQDAEGDLL
jgi:hypothetical protein